MVGVQGFEPWTPCSQSRCATRLRYTPTEPIFYTEMAYRGKYCKIRCMNALFISRLNKHFRGWIALSFLLASLLGAHWIGFAHSIAHSGIHHQSVEQTCVDQAPSLGHDLPSCHLLDALTLAGFAVSEPTLLLANNFLHEVQLASNESLPARIHVGLYQSRAPPSLIL